MFEPLAEERRILLITDAPAPVAVRGDAARLWQLVTNLVDNALRFTESGGSVTIAVQKVGDRAILRVTDTGAGIPAAHLPHVFERFYQADSARTLGGGGLGLSICRWIVNAHGGSIEAVSLEGKGSTFTVILPLTAAIPARDADATERASLEDSKDSRDRGVRMRPP
jgi:signal transduction histidine kinase